MKIETAKKFTCSDGTVFYDDTVAAWAHEEEFLRVKPIADRIPDSNVRGGEYVQHDPQLLKQIRRDLWKLVLDRHGESFPAWRKFDADQVVIGSMVGRVLSDFSGPLAKAWMSLGRFDLDNGREYEQPYYVHHPRECKERKEAATS